VKQSRKEKPADRAGDATRLGGATMPSSKSNHALVDANKAASRFMLKDEDSKRNDSSTFLDDSDSELSDPPVGPAIPPIKTKGKTKPSRATGSATKYPATEKTDGKATQKPRSNVQQAIKGKKSTPKTEGMRKSSPKKPIQKPVDPPIFEKIETRLSQSEAEDRMGVGVGCKQTDISFANFCIASGRPCLFPNEIFPC
jgi:hypothetical protein